MLERFSQFVLTAAVLGVMTAGTASAGPIEMLLTSGSESTSLLIGSTGTPSSVAYKGTLNGWSIESGTGGTSYSPNLVGLNLAGFVVTCAGGGCSSDPLTITLSATGFTVPIDTNQFLLGLKGTVSGGSVTTTGYYDTSNNYFCNGDDTGAYLLNQCGSGNLIGSLTLSDPSTGTSLEGGPDTIRSYSLTLSDTFSVSSPGIDPSFGVTSTITKVPEPGTLALFGAGLIGCAWLTERRRRIRRS